MNKRIQELAEQAGYTEAYYYSDDGPFIPAEFNKQKFAELIVKECLSKIENEAMQYSEPVWAFELVNDIKDHFGIEE